MTPARLALLCGAGLAAGAVNALAGGGSLISFPALLAVGLPSVPANVTNTVALWPGYVGGALGYAGALRARARELAALAVTTTAGSVVGVLLLLRTSPDIFHTLVPFLILASCLLLAVQPTVAQLVRRLPDRTGDGRRPVLLHACVLAAAVYGSYFGAGLGVMLLAVLGVLLHETLQETNGMKNALSLLINTVALIAFALFGPVDWAAVLVMAAASLVGGYAGAHVAQRLDARVLRATVVVFGVVVAVWLLLKG